MATDGKIPLTTSEISHISNESFDAGGLFALDRLERNLPRLHRWLIRPYLHTLREAIELSKQEE